MRFRSPSWKVRGEFELGETKVVSGKVTTDKFSGSLIMSSPDVVAPLADLEKVSEAPVDVNARCQGQPRQDAFQALSVRAYYCCTVKGLDGVCTGGKTASPSGNRVFSSLLVYPKKTVMGLRTPS